MKQIEIQMNQSMRKGIKNYSSNVRLVNCMSVDEVGGRSQSALIPVGGSSLVVSPSPSLGAGCRGAFRASTGSQEDGYLSTLYFVFGDSLFRYTRRGTLVKVGSFNSYNVTGSCTFAENQAQTSNDSWIYVCDQQSIYKFLAKASDDSVGATWQELSNLPHLPDGVIQATPAYITWSDYRLIMSAKDSNAWFYSETGTDTFMETNTYFGESSSDKTIRVVEHGGALWSFGAYSYDIFTRTGNRLNPYSNPKSASGKIGLASAESVATIDDYLFWVGRGDSANNGVYMADRSGAIKRVSNSGIEEILKSWQYQECAIGFCYVDRGQILYNITSIADDQTLCYNLSTNRWHSASSSDDGKEHAWDVAFPVIGYGVDDVLFGSPKYNAIAKLDRESIVDYQNRPVTRIWQSPVFTMDMKKFRLVRLLIDSETGNSDSYTEPAKLWAQVSLDGGATWKERVDRSLGVRGAFGGTVQVIGGGITKDLVIRIGTSDQSPIVIHKLRMDVEELAR